MNKLCSYCQVEKGLSDFMKCSRKKDGVGSWCKDCSRIHAKEKHVENREKNNQRARAWKLNNPEKVINYTQKWRLEHAEEIRNYSKTYAGANQEKIKAYRERTKELKAIKSKIYRQEHREQSRITRNAWIAANPEKKRDAQRRWRATNPEKNRENIRRANHKRLAIPKNKISSNISREIRASMKGQAKAGRHWETLVNFTIDHLKRHLEKLFTPEMTWDNYGTYWHIDHKIPIAVFNFEKPEHIDFQLCWSLENLQPLQATKNLSKGCKLSKPFQPSLAMAVGG